MKIIEHSSKGKLDETLCKKISLILSTAIQKFGTANLLVSGGSTPKNLFKLLSKEDLDWSKVNIGLVDERFVPVKSEKSNERLVKENFLINIAAEAKLLGMVYNQEDYQANLKIVDKVYKHFHSRIDACVLGMGTDGHTASLFPSDESSKQGLSKDFHSLVLNTSADVEPFKRITCSRCLIFKSENLFLMINGLKKMEILQSAKSKALPISVFFDTPKTELIVHYSPK